MQNETPFASADQVVGPADVLATVGRYVLGKDEAIRLAMTCLLARGHLLIEDIPGVGKTTLAHVLAGALGLDFQRIQFTSDLLPADILGVSIYDRETEAFHFHQGPVFAELVLADEINRATPKTQSALLEAMEERQVTADGETRYLPDPFFVIATKNPLTQVGTFPLPESQLDRFLMRVNLGYPDPAAERLLLAGEDRRTLLQGLQPITTATELLGWQKQADNVYVSAAILDYVQRLLQSTRESGDWVLGLSPRAGIALLRAARAWAMTDGRGQVLPEDVQAVFSAVASHRLQGHTHERHAEKIEQLLHSIPV